MITSQALQAAVVSVEQYIKDCDVEKEKHKHDTEQIKKWSAQKFESKVKLQVLYYAMGLSQMITEEQLKKDISHLSAYLKNMQSPRELDMFVQQDEKELIQGQRIMTVKLFTLRFIAGIEKKIL